MSSVYDFSQTAASNATVGSINWAEGQAPSTVNDSAREVMAAVAKWRDDLGGINTTGGTANSQTLTTDSTISALANGAIIGFKAGATNTGTGATLNVDSLGAKKMRRLGDTALIAGDITSGNYYLAAYSTAADSSSGGWIILNPSKVADGELSSNVVLLTGAQTIAGDKTITGNLLIQDDSQVGNLQFINSTWGGRVARIIARNSGTLIFRPTSAADTDDSTKDFRYNNTDDCWQFDAQLRVNGNLYLGGTVTDPAVQNSADVAAWAPGTGTLQISSAGSNAIGLNRKDSNGATVNFRRAGNIVGSVSVDLSSTTYNTTSDARFKTDRVPLKDAKDVGAIIDALVINEYTDTRDGRRRVGPDAQQFREIIPDIVSEEENGELTYEKAGAVPYLIAEIQSLRARLAALEAR